MFEAVMAVAVIPFFDQDQDQSRAMEDRRRAARIVLDVDLGRR